MQWVGQALELGPLLWEHWGFLGWGEGQAVTPNTLEARMSRGGAGHALVPLPEQAGSSLGLRVRGQMDVLHPEPLGI